MAKLMRAIVFERVGGPEVLQLKTDVPIPKPAAGQALVREHAAGIPHLLHHDPSERVWFHVSSLLYSRKRGCDRKASQQRLHYALSLVQPCHANTSTCPMPCSS